MNKYNHNREVNREQSEHRKGFSLIEVLVAISVLILVVFSATTLVVSIIRSNVRNINTLTAYGLAQEGLEAVRNIRDSNWLLGVRFDGVYSSLNRKVPVWGVKSMSIDGFYTVNINELQRAKSPITDPGGLSSVAPWELKEIDENDVLDRDNKDTLLRKYINSNTGEVQFKHTDAFNSGDEDTNFHRYIKIDNISVDPNKFQNMRVTSVVFWDEYGIERDLELTTELTDWNKGQI